MVTEPTPFMSGLIASSSIGFGGANAHLVIKPNFENKKQGQKYLPRLVLASGRTYEAVNYFLDGIQDNPEDNEFLALVDEIHKKNINGHSFRG